MSVTMLISGVLGGIWGLFCFYMVDMGVFGESLVLLILPAAIIGVLVGVIRGLKYNRGQP